MITTFAVLAVFAASLFLSTQNGGGITGAFSAAIPAQQAAQKTLTYINNNLLGGQSTATLVNVTEKSGLYLVTFKVDTQMYSTYVSKDGKLIFPQSLDMTQTSAPTGQTQSQTQPATSAVPTVQLFVMSFCPYGQQAEEGIAPGVGLGEARDIAGVEEGIQQGRLQEVDVVGDEDEGALLGDFRELGAVDPAGDREDRLVA